MQKNNRAASTPNVEAFSHLASAFPYKQRLRSFDTSYLPNGSKVKIDVGWIFSDSDRRVGHQTIRGNRQIVGSGDPAEYAPSQIVF
jgi:hypothetical protein